LRKLSAKLFAYNSNEEIPTIGEFTAKVSFKQKEHTASFRVVKSGNLLSFATARQLDLFSSALFRPTNSSAMLQCCTTTVDYYTNLMNNFKEVFNDKVGRLKDFKVKLHKIH
jgi:hypothetical protein